MPAEGIMKVSPNTTFNKLGHNLTNITVHVTKHKERCLSNESTVNLIEPEKLTKNVAIRYRSIGIIKTARSGKGRLNTPNNCKNWRDTINMPLQYTSFCTNIIIMLEHLQKFGIPILD